MPRGSSARPAASSSRLILAATSRRCRRRVEGAAQGEMPARARARRRPSATGCAAGGAWRRSRSPRDGPPGPGEQGEPDQLVHGPGADVGGVMYRMLAKSKARTAPSSERSSRSRSRSRRSRRSRSKSIAAPVHAMCWLCGDAAAHGPPLFNVTKHHAALYDESQRSKAPRRQAVQDAADRVNAWGHRGPHPRGRTAVASACASWPQGGVSRAW